MYIVYQLYIGDGEEGGDGGEGEDGGDGEEGGVTMIGKATKNTYEI